MGGCGGGGKFSETVVVWNGFNVFVGKKSGN